MKDLFQLERTFQDLKQVLAGTVSTRWSLVAVCRFLEEIEDRETEAESYLLELVQDLPGLLHTFNPVGLTPGSLMTLADRLETAWHMPVLSEVSGFREALRGLHLAAATLYAYAGDVHGACIALSGSDEELAWLSLDDGGTDLTPLERLERSIQKAETQGHSLEEPLRQIAQAWTAARSPAPAQATAPVVERPAISVDTSFEFEVGGLRSIHVELYGERAARDDLHTDVSVFGASSAADELFRMPVQAARRLLARTYPKLSDRFFSGRISFDQKPFMHEGRSADLALALAFFVAILRRTGQRRRYHVAPQVALTGGVDADGNVLPVDEGALAVKLRAVFFSPVRVLAVPATQLATVQKIVSKWTIQYPHRTLDVIGVEHLREVLYDRRLTGYEEISAVRHAARWAWRRKFSIGGVATIAVLLVIVGYMLFGPLDKNPVTAEYTGEVLLVKNRHGEALEEIRLENPTILPDALDRYVAFADLNRDGQNEIIWGQELDTTEEHVGFIQAKSVGAIPYSGRSRFASIWTIPGSRTCATIAIGRRTYWPGISMATATPKCLLSLVTATVSFRL